jgi:ornithine carbamoyltransferase
MQERNLGRSGLRVSLAGLGCNNLGGRLDLAGAKAVVHKAIDLGVTLFDTAEMYGPHTNEVLVGKALKDRRDEAFIATKFGMDVTLLCPDERYRLDERYMGWAADNVAESGGSLQVSHDVASAYAGADVVYAKSWGALPYFGNWGPEKPIRDQFQHFMVDDSKMALTNDGVFSHCLPLRITTFGA